MAAAGANVDWGVDAKTAAAAEVCPARAAAALAEAAFTVIVGEVAEAATGVAAPKEEVVWPAAATAAAAIILARFATAAACWIATPRNAVAAKKNI